MRARGLHFQNFVPVQPSEIFRTTTPAAANPNVPVTNVAEPKPWSQFSRRLSPSFASARFAQTEPSSCGKTGGSAE